MRRFFASAAAFGGLAAALPGQATEQFMVTPAAGTASQRFGLALVVEGDLMVVGAPYEDSAANDAGAVDVYRFDAAAAEWAFEQQLFASDAEAGARFGSAVAVDADVLVVGAPFKDTTAGADAGQLYVFRYDAVAGSWSQEQRLKSSVGNVNDALGTSVAVSGNLILGGAPKADTTSGADSGVAVAYRYKNSIVKWVEEKQLVDSDAAASDLAGSSVALLGSTAFVASPSSNEGGAYVAGSVAVWSVSGSTWSQGQEITASTPQQYAGFGATVRLRGDLLGITAPTEDVAGLYDAGACYLFRLSAGSWVEEQRFTAPTPTAYENFGNDIALGDDLVAIGVQSQDVASQSDAGAVHLWRHGRRSGWVHDAQLSATDSASADRLGARVGITDRHVLAAADGNDTASGSDWGVVYGYVTEEMTLSILPSSPLPDEAITFSAFRGAPDATCMVTIEDVSGTPLFLPLIVFVFAADDTLTFTVDAPNPAYGLHVGMRAYKVSPTGPVVFSELAYVDI